MSKKKQVGMPPLKQQTKVIWKWWIAVGLAVGLLFGLALWTRSGSNEEAQNECVQKNVVNKYVCKIVGSVPDQDVLAVECLTK